MSRHAPERLCGICGVTPRRIAPTLRRLDPFVEQSIPDHYDPDAIYVLLAIVGTAVMDRFLLEADRPDMWKFDSGSSHPLQYFVFASLCTGLGYDHPL